MIGRPQKKRSETSTVDKEKAQMKAPRIAHRNLPRFLGALAAAAALILALGAGSASAAFGITDFDGEVIQAGGEPATQAGSHPYEAGTEFDVTTFEEPGFCFPICELPEGGGFKDIEVKLPAGFVGNPRAVGACPNADIITPLFVFGVPPACRSAVVGTTVLRGNAALLPLEAPVFNLEPGPNAPARFGFRALTSAVVLTASIRTGSDYGTTVKLPNTNQVLPVTGTELRFWGVPGDSSHEAVRGGPYGKPVRPFLSNPTSCTGPVLTGLRLNSWQEPNVYHEAGFLSHNAAMEPVGADSCDKLAFEPSLSLQSDPPSAASPTALSATLHVPQHNDDPGGLISSHLKKAVVKLPPGVAVNAAAANGLGGCSEAQFGLDNNNPVGCPSDSRIGLGEIVSPLLELPLTGSIYLAQPNANPFGSLLAIYYVVEAQGVTIKIAGKIDTDPVTGQVTATFDNNPQLPFSDFKLDFFGGPGGVLVNPNDCGDKTYASSVTSWSGGTANTNDSFSINQNCSTGGFNPGLSAGSTNPVGGAYAPFAFNVTRNDGEQNVSAIGVSLPKGESAKLAGVPLCPAANAANGSCPAASQVGSVNIAAGAGPNPVWVPQPGKAPTAAYLSGPYKGQPYSLAFKVPVQAGPFDLGTVAVRASIQIDPITAQISVASDSLPQILQGIPISYRQIHIGIDRPGFTLNPTNCGEQAVASTIVSDKGAVATPASRFQVTDCGTLGFKPKLYTRIWGKTNRGAHPKLRAILAPRKGDANVGRIALTLPRSEFLDQAHIKTVCTRVQFAANACPADSVYGSAIASSPLLANPLQGPVYLRSSNHKLPDLVADLHGEVDIQLAGRIDSKNKGIRTTFESPPDVPVTKFTLYMKGGKKGLLVNSRNICNATYRSNATLRGQNGRRTTLKPVLKNNRCKKGKKKK
jgi:hypothetical protein